MAAEAMDAAPWGEANLQMPQRASQQDDGFRLVRPLAFVSPRERPRAKPLSASGLET
jgi:hypothetical protein